MFQKIFFSFVILAMLLNSAAGLFSGTPPRQEVEEMLPVEIDSGTGNPDVGLGLASAALPSTTLPSEDSAYRRVIDLGDGHKQALISTTPINYLAEDGSWQPIQAQFEIEAGAFTNRTNSLQVAVGEKLAMLNLRSGETYLSWQPQALVLSGADGQEVTLALPLEAESAEAAGLTPDGSTVQYPQSWSLTGLIEEVVTSSGGVEERLVLAERPQAAAWEGEAYLTLRASLTLMAGAGIYVAGEPQSAAFITNGNVEIRTAAGEVGLILQAPLAYEAADAGQRVQGRYRLTPQGEQTWLVEVQTPWQWWQASERHYPAVLDPYMSIHHGDEAGTYFDGVWDFITCEFDEGDLQVPSVKVGRLPNCNGVFRTLVKFDTDLFPLLPVGATVNGMELIVAPASGYFPSFGGGNTGYSEFRSSAAANVAVRQVTGEWGWSGGMVYSYEVNDTPIGEPVLLYAYPPEDRAFYSVAHFPLPTTLYYLWKGGDNHGLELRLEDETSNLTSVSFFEIPTSPTWSSADIDTTPAGLGATDGGGFMLMIDYNASELQEGQIYGYDPDYLLPTEWPDVLNFTEHHYALPEISTPWSAVAVKGIEENLVQIPEATFPVLKVGNVTSEATPESTNYVMMRGNPGAADLDLEVLNFAYTGEQPDATEYLVEVNASTSFNNGQPIEGGEMQVYTLTMNSWEDILRVFDMSLVAGTTAQVKVDVGPGNPGVNAQLYPPANDFAAFAKDYANIRQPGELWEVETSGSWGLVLEYAGPPEEKSKPPTPYMIPITVTVMACLPGSIPTDDGCWTLTRPDATMYCEDVGPYWIRSQEKFATDAGTGELYNTSQGVMMDWGSCAGGMDSRYAVITNRVDFTDAAPFTMHAHNQSAVMLMYWPTTGAYDPLWLWTGGFNGNPNDYDMDYGHLTPVDVDSIKMPLDGFDAKTAALKVDPRRSWAEGYAEIVRSVETTSGVLETFSFTLDWIIQPDHLLDTAYSEPVDYVSGPAYAEVGVMELYPDHDQWEMDYKPGANGRFALLRTQARIAHNADLGSKWTTVQAVILPDGGRLPGEGTSGNSYPCRGNCLDIRHPTLDDASNENRSWVMPDVEVNGQAGMVAFSQPGSVDIFSTDQPNVTEDVTLPFSFKTFGGEFSVSHAVCPLGESIEIVTVIHGNTSISLPGLESGGAPGIGAEIWLCENSLRQVILSYSGLIPVGSTGLALTKVGGRLTITPQTTEITIDVDYCYSPACELTRGTAKLTINTAGLLSAQITNGSLIGFMNYDGSATITWNPMSFSVNLRAWMDIWILHGDGNLSASVWQGRGWQDQYYWLPDDETTHFAGSYEVTLTIEEGDILSVWWFPDIPWDDWDLVSFSLQIGEFHCGSCSDGYEYGVQGTFSHGIFTLGYDVGVFVGFESGLDIVIAGDQHILVNQYPDGKSTSAGSATFLVGMRAVQIAAQVAPDPAADEFIQDLVIAEHTSSMLVGMGWENLSRQPHLTLIRPDGVEITPENSDDYHVNLAVEDYSIAYGVVNPSVGTWQAKISNATAEDYWHLMFLANKRVPEFNLQTPAAAINWNPNVDGLYPVEWEVPTEYAADADLAVSLFYTKTVTGVVTPTVGLIIDNGSYTAGSFDWDMGALGEGNYQVWGLLSNGGKDYYHEHPEMLGDGQWMGVSRSVAPGTITLTDDVNPATPTGLYLIQLYNALQACWEPNADIDLAGYILIYSWTDVHGTAVNRQQRVAADTPYDSADDQCARIGGLNHQYTTVRLVAYDTSGNTSSTISASEWVVNTAPDAGPAIDNVDADDQVDHSIVLTWDHTTAAGYRIYYAIDKPAGPGVSGEGATEGDSPIIVGAVGSYTIHGLPAGHRIHFVIQSVDADGRRGPFTKDMSLWLSNEDDGDGDGVPDDWEDAYGLDNPQDDPDGDGLANAVVVSTPGGPVITGGEYQWGTNPNLPDSDGDGFTDGEEVSLGSDPTDPGSKPESLLPLARLVISPTALMFRASTLGDPPLPQYVNIENVGIGVLTPTASADVTWLDVEVVDDQIKVTIDPAGLARGQYLGMITVYGAVDALVGNSPQTVTVLLGVFESVPNVTINYIYLPIALR